MKETYLGDGAYAKFDGYEVTIYTSDGIEQHNNVVLGPYELMGLLTFLKEIGALDDIPRA
jgi:hypothetical protein